MKSYGTIRIHLEELIKERGISKNKFSQWAELQRTQLKNKLCKRAEMERTQLNNYCNNKVARVDLDVLARMCTVLECDIGDLLEFVPPEKTEESK